MKKHILLLGFMMVMTSWVTAQQLPQFTQYLLNDFAINPAIAGTKPYFLARTNHRYQWTGLTDAPRTFVFSLHGPIVQQKMGLGGYVFTDIVGPTRRTGIQLSYAYHLKITEKMNLSFGVTGGVLQFTVDGDKLNLEEEGDIAVSGGIMSVTTPDAGAGLYLYGDNYFVSFSAPQLLGNKVQFFDGYTNTLSKLSNHFFASAGYTFRINDEFSVQPSAQAKYVDPLPVQVDVTARGIYQDQVWLGASYRTGDEITNAESVGFLFGYTFQKNLMLGYSYDLSLSNIRKFNDGSHELMLGFRFKNRKKAKGGDAPSID
ncbi:MAG: type IX secretion system membrane protein PorP/SprF [Salibacteraceae bacterium]